MKKLKTFCFENKIFMALKFLPVCSRGVLRTDRQVRKYTAGEKLKYNYSICGKARPTQEGIIPFIKPVQIIEMLLF